MKPSDGYIALIANPKSGASSSHKRLRRSFRQYLNSEGYEVRLLKTESLGHASDLALQAHQDPRCQMVVVAGGDGTVREVVQGLVGSTKPLMIIPSGTENLLASELGFGNKLSTLIQTFQEGYTRPLDLGTINGKYFTCVSGFGFDGEIMDRVTKMRDGHIDYFDYASPLWQTFWSHTFHPIQVELDGQVIFNGLGMVVVGNATRYALGLSVLRHADVSDGLLDVCIFKCTYRPHLLKHYLTVLFKRHTRCSDVIYQQGTRVKVSSPTKKVKTQVDGDPGPPLPADISVVPGALQVMVPKEFKPEGTWRRLFRLLG